ncbi:hypothetical protein FHN55_11850 [Streptomyces sp. NP160]|uniref:hypothetical protein n=1 Tax=Streptomyces sp. NP160 TaxID=2586637 RepID=UPI0011195B82|nr:hypothetical protein [Streptomyces sp. NP160]TNM67183.1 hypothetical protein FHN55_11850 [Streptomyces sp. NP160]
MAPEGPARDDRSAREQQRRRHDETFERRSLEAVQRRRAAVDLWRHQRDAEERDRREVERRRAADRLVHDEQVRLRHEAEDEERRRRRALDQALRRERVVAHLVRSDPARQDELLRAHDDVEHARAGWQQADDVRRQWPSRWPW